MKYILKVYSIWHPGKRVDAGGNPHQEDSMFPAHGAATEGDRLFILCDGMGGHEAGEVASATVCEAMGRSVLAAAPDPEGGFTEEIFRQALSDAYDALDAKDNGTARKKMGTTMTFLKLHEGGCLIAHMGDSRVYHIRPGKDAESTRVLFHTEDHSLVNDLVRVGELTPEEAKHSRQKNVITRAMQPCMERRPKADIHHIRDIAPGDYFYLCSDGMLENMEDNQLCYFFSDEAGDDACKVESLLNATQENRDNHSAIIVHILDVKGPAVPAAPLPAASVAAAAGRPLVGGMRDGGPAAAERATGGVPPERKSHRRRLWVVVAAVLILLVAGEAFHSLRQPKEPAGKETVPSQRRPPQHPRTVEAPAPSPAPSAGGAAQPATVSPVQGGGSPAAGGVQASGEEVQDSSLTASPVGSVPQGNEENTDGVVPSNEDKSRAAVNNNAIRQGSPEQTPTEM